MYRKEFEMMHHQARWWWVNSILPTSYLLLLAPLILLAPTTIKKQEVAALHMMFFLHHVVPSRKPASHMIAPPPSSPQHTLTMSSGWRRLLFERGCWMSQHRKSTSSQHSLTSAMCCQAATTAEPGEYTGSAKRIPTITNLPLRKPNQLCNTRHVIWVIDCTEVDTLRIRAMLRQICRKWGRWEEI